MHTRRLCFRPIAGKVPSHSPRPAVGVVPPAHPLPRAEVQVVPPGAGPVHAQYDHVALLRAGWQQRVRHRHRRPEACTVQDGKRGGPVEAVQLGGGGAGVSGALRRVGVGEG